MSYQRTPPQFMQNIHITPHYFSDPEHPEHGQYVHLQLRHDLYNEALYKITGCQFSLFGGDDEELQVVGIKQCEGPDPLGGFAEKLRKQHIQKQQLDMISCMDWRVVNRRKSGQSESKYRIKIFQSKRDLFYSQLHPYSSWKLLKYYLFN